MDTEKECADPASANPCPIARALMRMGDAWTMLILRDANAGATRFDQFQKNLKIAPNILTRRLVALVEAGMLEKHRYSERPPREEYRLTERGREVLPILYAIGAWGTKHFGEGGVSRAYDAETGAPIDPVVIDRVSGRAIGSFPIRVVVPD